jgi:hypothetical protein
MYAMVSESFESLTDRWPIEVRPRPGVPKRKPVDSYVALSTFQTPS